MKITCQACQSKYTIADDKIQGKVAKIRCRKCGATVLVDASASAGQANGSAPSPVEVWSVSVAEGDQRSMQLHEVVDAYNTGVITGETYLWKEGMGDWLPLSEVPEIVAALHDGAGSEPIAEAAPDPVVADYSAPAAQPVVAARRETGRGRGDLFSSRAAEEEVATSAAAPVTRATSSARGATAGLESSQGGSLTGARDEHSVLFSLSALTGGGPAPASSIGSSVGAAKNDDSGLIDLNALAMAQQARPVEAAAPLAAPAPFLFPAALGSVEAPQEAEAAPKSKASIPLIIGGALAVVAFIGAFVVLSGGKKEGEAGPGSSAAALTVAPPEPAAVAPTPAPTAEEPAAPAESASAAPVAKAPGKKAPAGASPRPARPSAAAPAAPAAAPALPAPKPKSACGCSAGDLQCQIRCSATGH